MGRVGGRGEKEGVAGHCDAHQPPGHLLPPTPSHPLTQKTPGSTVVAWCVAWLPCLLWSWSVVVSWLARGLNRSVYEYWLVLVLAPLGAS